MLDTNKVWILINFKPDSNKYTYIIFGNCHSSDLVVNPMNT